MMSTREHAISVRKILGFTTVEIGARFNMSPSAVDAMFCRAKQQVGDRLRSGMKRDSKRRRANG